MTRYYLIKKNEYNDTYCQCSEYFDDFEEIKKVALEKNENGEEVEIAIQKNSYWSQYQNRQADWAETFCH